MCLATSQHGQHVKAVLAMLLYTTSGFGTAAATDWLSLSIRRHGLASVFE